MVSQFRCILCTNQNLATGLAQSVERLTAEWEVVGSIPGDGPILRVLKYLRNEGTTFALQTGRPSRGSDDHIKWWSRKKKIVSLISTFVLNTLTLKKVHFFLMLWLSFELHVLGMY